MDRHDLLYFNTKIFVLDFLPGSILVHFELDFKEVFRLFRILVEENAMGIFLDDLLEILVNSFRKLEFNLLRYVKNPY